MALFPTLDPIPLPAPVWVFKSLHLLTFTLHIFAVQLLLGGLIVSSLWAVWGRSRETLPMTGASNLLARQLPIIMIYVINLGVPPLLFTQVLYGTSFYTSSILIGAFWISAVFMIILGYYGLYMISGRAAKGKPWGWIGIGALAIFASVAFIYVNNMTLMLRPQVWREMYRLNPFGTQLAAPGDPTILPRWLFIMTGSLVVSGVWMMVLGRKERTDDVAASFLRRWGAWQIVVFGIAQVLIAHWVVQTQSPTIRESLASGALSSAAGYVWMGGAAALVLFGLISGARPVKSPAQIASILAAVVVFVQVGAMAIYRDRIRDLALLNQGYDVWKQVVVVNWPVVGVFLGVFVIGLGSVGWLIWVAAQSRTQKGNPRYV